MPQRYTNRIIRHLSHGRYEPSRIEHLAQDLGVDPEDFEAFRMAIAQLGDQGRVVVTDDAVVELPPFGDELTGEFRRNERGFGFVCPKDPRAHGDLFIPRGETMDALTGDIVRAAVRKRRRRPGDEPGKEYSGVIVEIIQRKKTNFTGELEKRGNQWLVQPDGKSMTDPVMIRDVTNAHVGDKVVFEIVEFAEGTQLAEGVITKVLGESGKPDVETEAVIESYSLRTEFPEECIEQTRAVTRKFDDEIERALDNGEGFQGREDRTPDFIFTIDPPDAKDYDDAISIERTEDGWVLGIHIADVAHFIERGSALDEEAIKRGNSVYLPKLVIPMLPELLSNGICSLQEGVPRYCKSAYIEYDQKAEVVSTAFAQTCINSRKRLTYLEAQALIDDDIKEARKHARTEPVYTDELIEALKHANTLSKRIRSRRKRAGMIHLDLPEVELVFDEKGNVIDAQPEDDAYTHTLIEMFMVEANEAVARLFQRMEVPLIRRVHPEPVPGSFDDLSRFVQVAGFRIPKNPTREELQSLLDTTAGSPAAPAVHFAVLRTLTKAEYSPDQIGHYALASEAYSHFTSPIRRYPDLTVHRALSEYLSRTENGSTPPRSEKALRQLGKDLRDAKDCLDEQTLREIGSKCSSTEVNAADAERELRNYLVMSLLAEHIGEVFEGVVTGVAKPGVFVQIQKYLVEGLIKTEDLPTGGKAGGRWRLDQRSGALVHEGTGRSFRMGDRVGVTVSQVDLARRQLELLIPDEEASKREGVGKALKLGGGGGGLESAGDHWDKAKKLTGAQKRSKRSRSRDKRKSDHRAEKKGKGKRQ